MRPARLLCVLALVGGLAAGAGCGSGNGTIAPTEAQALKSGLDKVRAAIADGDCLRTRAAIQNVRSQVTNLDVPRRLESNLRDGIGKLSSAAGGECKDAGQPTETTETTATTPTVTLTGPTTTTTTTTPTVTTAPTTPTTPTTPIDTTTVEPPTGGVTPDEPTGVGPGGEG